MTKDGMYQQGDIVRRLNVSGWPSVTPGRAYEVTRDELPMSSDGRGIFIVNDSGEEAFYGAIGFARTGDRGNFGTIADLTVKELELYYPEACQALREARLQGTVGNRPAADFIPAQTPDELIGELEDKAFRDRRVTLSEALSHVPAGVRRLDDEVSAMQAAAQAASAALPDANPKTRFGIAKPPLNLIPGPARALIAMALLDGQEKYGRANWRVDPVTASTYLNACERHLCAWTDREDEADDSHVHHLAHAAACLIIIMDAEVCGTLQDDRPSYAPLGALLKKLTKPLPEVQS